MGSPARSAQAPLLRQPARAAASVRMQDDDVDVVDRAFAAAVYLFPITDGIFFGKFLFTQVPVFGALCLPIIQASAAFDSIPFSGLIFFIGLSSMSRNPGLSRFLRFNLQQAILLDIAFIIPNFFGNAGNMFPIEVQQVCSNTVFYSMVLAIGYSWFSIAQGKTPDQVPVVSEAA